MAGLMKAYRNFIVSLTPHREEEGGKWLKAWVIHSPAGEQGPSEAEKVEIPARLRSRTRALERRQLDLEGLIALGEELAAMLLPPSVRELYRGSLDGLGEREGLRIQIRADSPELGALPWEYTYVADPDTPGEGKGPDGFLALKRDISLVRYKILKDPAKLDPVPPGNLRLAVLLSNVSDPAFPELDLAQEEVNLRQALDGVKGVEPGYLRPGTRVNLHDLLTTNGAQVFHFSGHGEFPEEQGDEPDTYVGHGRLMLTGDDGRPDPWEASEMGTYLRGLGIRLAVLGACEAARRDTVTPWSSVATALVKAKIPAVVGMQYTIRDGNAVAFSRSFYQALARGKSIDAAVSEGRMGIFNRSGGSERDWGVPVLYLREQDSNLQLFPKDMRPVRRNAFMAFCAIALLVIWFVLHILPLAERLRDDLLGSIGLPVSAGLLIVWLVSRVYQQFKAALWNWGELPILDWLQKRSARLVSASALAIAALLFASTTSVYLYHPPPDSNPPNAVRIQLVDTHADTDTGSGKSFLGGLKLETTGENTSAGRPIFFPFFSPELKLTVVEPPRGWELTVNGKAPPDSLSLLPVQPTVLRVVKTVYPPMIRLLPSKTMVADEKRLLPLPGEQDPLIPYRLVVTVHGADESVLKMEEWDNFQQGSIYLGSDMAKRNVFDPGKPGTRVDRLRADIENRIADLEECYPMDLSDPDTLLQWTDIWNNEKFIVLDPWPEPGQRVSVQIFEKSDDNEDLNGTVRAEYDLDIGAQQPEVYTICLNWQESHS